MVILHVKKGDESQFLFETTVKTPINETISKLVKIYNGRLKIQRICTGDNNLTFVGHLSVCLYCVCVYLSVWLAVCDRAEDTLFDRGVPTLLHYKPSF